MHLTSTDDGYCLTANGMSVSVVCEHQTANKPQHDNIQRQLSKLGGTVYECTEVTFDDGFNEFIPNSVLSELRRQLLDALTGHSTPQEPSCQTASHIVAAAPRYAYPYLYNIANRVAADFYHTDSPTAYELKGGDGPLMQCRHCLRYALGYCVKHGGRRPDFKEPLSLRLGDGRLFRLEFDCKNCQMNVYASR